MVTTPVKYKIKKNKYKRKPDNMNCHNKQKSDDVSIKRFATLIRA